MSAPPGGGADLIVPGGWAQRGEPGAENTAGPGRRMAAGPRTPSRPPVRTVTRGRVYQAGPVTANTSTRSDTSEEPASVSGPVTSRSIALGQDSTLPTATLRASSACLRRV